MTKLQLKSIFSAFGRKIQSKIEKKRIGENSDRFIKYLRNKGVTIGQDCAFFSPSTQVVDLTRPELICIGNKVQITRGCIILTHGFEWCVLRELHSGQLFGSAGSVTIGNNVYLGMRCIILKNSSIGNNTVIGAGSIVSKDVPDNVVVAGNPARVLMDIETFHKKYQQNQLREAKNYARAIFEKRKRLPELTDFKEFFYLFLRPEEAAQAGINLLDYTTMEHYHSFKENHDPLFKSFDDFLQFCGFEQSSKDAPDFPPLNGLNDAFTKDS